MSEHVSDEQLSLLIDGELSLIARTAVNAHLSSCPACAERHDAFVELTAALRLQPPLVWSEAVSTHTIARLPRRRAPRERALPLALALGALATTLAAVELPYIVGPGIAGSLLHALSGFAPSGFLPGDRLLLILLATVAALGVFVYPLSRWR